MAENFDLKLPSRKVRRKFKLLDMLIIFIVVGLIAVLGVTLTDKLRLQHEVSAARVISDRVIKDIASNNAVDARSMGDASFQKAHSTTQLQQLFVSANGVAKGGSSVDRQTVSNAKNLQIVNVIYRYVAKPQYFIRVTVAKSYSGSKWQLIGLSGNSSEAPLIIK